MISDYYDREAERDNEGAAILRDQQVARLARADNRLRWLLLQLSDDDLQRVGILVDGRDRDDWLARTIALLDEKLTAFLLAHQRLRGSHSMRERLLGMYSKFFADEAIEAEKLNIGTKDNGS